MNEIISSQKITLGTQLEERNNFFNLFDKARGKPFPWPDRLSLRGNCYNYWERWHLRIQGKCRHDTISCSRIVHQGRYTSLLGKVCSRNCLKNPQNSKICQEDTFYIDFDLEPRCIDQFGKVCKSRWNWPKIHH